MLELNLDFKFSTTTLFRLLSKLDPHGGGGGGQMDFLFSFIY